MSKYFLLVLICAGVSNAFSMYNWNPAYYDKRSIGSQCDKAYEDVTGCLRAFINGSWEVVSVAEKEMMKEAKEMARKLKKEMTRCDHSFADLELCCPSKKECPNEGDKLAEFSREIETLDVAFELATGKTLTNYYGGL